MTARTSWNVRAEEPPSRDIGSDPAAARRPIFADLLDSRFDESGRLVRGGGTARSRVAERLGRGLPDVGADELEEAVARLSRQVDAAARAAATPHAGARAADGEFEARERRPAQAERRGSSGGHAAEREPPVMDVLNRLEARLAALSEEAGRRAPDDAAASERPQPAAPGRAAGSAQPEPAGMHDRRVTDRRSWEEEPAGRAVDDGYGGSGAVERALDGLLRRVEALDSNDRSLARALEALQGQLGELREGLDGRHKPDEELTLIAERLDALGDRLAGAELGPSALNAVERSFEHLLERIDRLERATGRASPPAELWDRLERLRRHLQALPGQEALSKLEDRIVELAERMDAAAEHGAGGQAIERLESQLDEMAGALAGLKQSEQARARDLEKRLAELLRRVEAAPRGGAVDLSAMESRLEDVLARIDGAPAPQLAEAIASLEARLDGLARALDERPAIDLDPLSRQLKQLQGRLDEVGRSVKQAGGRTEPDIGPINQRLEEIQRRLESDPPPAAAGDGELAERLRAIEERLANLSAPSAPDLEPVRDQLAVLAERLDGASPADGPDAARMTALMERLERLLETIGGEDRLAGIGETIGKIGASLEAMSDAPALEDIAELRTEIALLRREMKSLPGGEAAASEQLAPLLKDLAGRLEREPSEPPLTVADLETQIDRIVRMMEEPASERRDLAPIEESLRRIEEQLDSGGRALPSALSQMDGVADGDAEGFTRLVSALSSDLSALKEAASSSQRNMRDTLQSVHETLEGVARRIAALEGQDSAGGGPRQPAAPAEAPRRQAASRSAEPPPIPEIALGGGGQQPMKASPRPEPRPAGDSAVAADPASAGAHGLLGRLTSGQLLKRATGGRAESFSPAQEDGEEGPDLPLEPGSHEPMSSTLENAPSSDTALFAGAERRTNRVPGRAGVINRRNEAGGYVADDFLSAARRAAQAAAVEAAEAERMVETDSQVGALQRLFGIMKARRRVVIAGALAVAVAFAALQFQKLRFGGEESSVAQAPVSERRSATPAEDTDGSSGVAARPSAEPSPPDSTLAFGEPLTVPGELQRRAEADAAVEERFQPIAEARSDGVPRDSWPPESIGPDALRRAAGEGDPAAQFEVAARYAEGRGVTQDVAMAAQWYRRAAEGGLVPAQYRVGSIYEKGIGVAKDPGTAMQWYRRAAEAGNAKAMHNLAVLYAEGIDGNSDLERAAEWFRRAAEHGVRDSQFNIGVLYARGLGVPQDLIEAYKWFAIAAQSGDSQAGERRNFLAESMSQDDLAKAQAAARDFRPLIVDPAANVVEPPEGGWGDPPSVNVSLSGPDLVRQVQDLLVERGFDVGPADGRLGPRTRSAVAAFQEELGLPATGEIDAGVVVALQQQAD